MMTLTKTWNQPVQGVLMTESGDIGTQLQNYLWQLKEGLVNSSVGAWEVLASSASGESWVASRDDNWVSPSTIEYGQPDSSAQRAWMVLKSPTSPRGPYYMILDYWSTGPATDYQMQVYFTKSLPDLSTLSTTARPAPTGDEWSHLDVTPWSVEADVFSHNCSLAVASDGSFVLFGNRAGHPYFTSAWVFNIMTQDTVKPADGVGAVSMIWGASTVKMTQANLPRFQGLHPLDGSQVDIAACTLLAGSTKVMDAMPEDTTTQRHLGLPVWMFATTAAKLSMRGRLEDLYWAPDELQDGYPSYVNSAFEGVKVGPLWVPAEESPRI